MMLQKTICDESQQKAVTRQNAQNATTFTPPSTRDELQTAQESQPTTSRRMKRAREPEEPPPSPPSPTPPPTFGIDSPIDSDGRATPVPDQTVPDTHAPRGRPVEPRTKIVSLSRDGENDDGEGREQAGSAIMSCLLHRERMDFPTYDAYEAHYTKEHLNRCIECRRNFPSPLYLSLHGDEWHDPFVAVKRDKGEHTVRQIYRVQLCPVHQHR